MEQYNEQLLRSPEKLLSKVALPDKTTAEVYGDPATKEIEDLFLFDADGKIIEYADLRNTGDTKDAVKRAFEERGFALTDDELKKLTKEFFQHALNEKMNAIDEDTATKN